MHVRIAVLPWERLIHKVLRHVVVGHEWHGVPLQVVERKPIHSSRNLRMCVLVDVPTGIVIALG